MCVLLARKEEDMKNILLAAPIDGHWGRWSSWSACSKTCGDGTKHRTRKCNDPMPANSGKSCSGDDKQQEACIVRRCGLGKVYLQITTFLCLF